MKNYEKYAEEIKKNEWDNTCKDFIEPIILKTNECDDNCTNCSLIQMLWLFEEYEEPEVDWSKVEVDTPILVKEKLDSVWTRRYFAGYDDEIVYAWYNGGTSWSKTGKSSWKYAKLAEAR
jgi:hypothetical protein